jgi:hypothetical protein
LSKGQNLESEDGQKWRNSLTNVGLLDASKRVNASGRIVAARITGSNTARQIVVDKLSREEVGGKALKAVLKICPEMALLTVE